MAAEEQVLYRLDGSVAWITLNQPETGNALTWEMRERVGDLFEQASADLAVRAVVVTCAGDKFCTGANLAVRQPTLPRPEGVSDRAIGDAARMIKRGWQRLISSILDCEKPVIAAVNGTAA